MAHAAMALPAKRQARPTVRTVSDGESVYLLVSAGRLIKIGRSVQVETRARDLSTASGHKLAVRKAWPLPGRSRDVEILAHEAFAWCRQEGEWFACLPEEVIAIVDALVAGEAGRARELSQALAIRAEHCPAIERATHQTKGRHIPQYKKIVAQQHLDALWPLYVAAHEQCVALGLPADAHRL